MKIKIVAMGLVIVVRLSFLAAQTASQGFFLDDWNEKNMVNPSSVSVPITTSIVTSTVNVDATNVVTKISKQVYGHNSAAFNGKINANDIFMNTIKTLSPNVIRWPGGNMSNDYFWDATSLATCPKDIPPANSPTSALPPATFKFNDQFYGANKTGWTLSLDGYYDMLTKTNSTGIICVNYAYARYGTSLNPVLTAAKYAADWVRYDNGRTKYWEIGNENYGAWETGYEIDQSLNKDGQPKIISGDLYGKHAAIFIAEMKKVAAEIGSEIKIGVVLFHNQYDYTGSILGTWNAGVIPQIVNKADYLILHNYYTKKTGETIGTILKSALDIPEKLMGVGLADLKKYGGLNTMPIALTEWNIVAEGSGQQTSYINGVHAALNLGELIENKWGLANRWDFLNGWSNGDSHGLFADGESDITKYSPRPPFYYMYYFQKFFGDKMVVSTVTGNADIKSYASKFTSGQVGLVLVNSGANTQTVDLKMNNFTLGTKYHYYLLTGGADAEYSRKVLINGNGPAGNAGGAANYETLKANATNIVGNSIKITLPKYSVAYVLVENSTVTTASEINVKQGTNNLLNGTGTFNFPNPIAIGSSSLGVQFTVENTGIENLTIGNITLGGANPGQFSLTKITNSTITSAGKATFMLTFKPTFAGEKTVIVSIPNNDLDENPYTFIVHATTSVVTGFEDEKDALQLTIYPNPSTTGLFTLSKEIEWKLTSLTGVEIKTGYGNTVDLTGHPKGLYLIKFETTFLKILFE